METDETVTEGAGNKENVGDDDGDNEHILRRDAGISPEVEIIAVVKMEQLSQILERHQSPSQISNVEASEGEAPVETEGTFYTPSGFDLTRCCQKLNITYDQKAYQIWGNCNISVIKSYSDSIETIPSEPMRGFQCLSLLLTGSPDSFHLISLSVNRKLCERLLEGGKF